jgi:hypothetical protein
VLRACSRGSHNFIIAFPAYPRGPREREIACSLRGSLMWRFSDERAAGLQNKD